MSFSYLYLRPLSPNKGVRRIYRICSFQGTPLALSSAIQVHGIHALGSLMMHLFFYPGGHLLSHTDAVPSAGWVLTFVFGMGTGVSPSRIATRNP